MNRDFLLNGTWKLFYHNTLEESKPDYHAYPMIPASVPGNVELDLKNAGILPADEFKGMNTRLTEEYESYEWWYELAFPSPVLKAGERCVLEFEGVDTIAEYYLNDRKIGDSDNFFISHEFDVTDSLQQVNTLTVHILSCVSYQMDQPYNAYLFYGWGIDRSNIFVRKPAHTFGWDIFPRVVSAGIWKSVKLSIRDAYSFEDYGYFVRSANEGEAKLCMYFAVNAPKQELYDGSLSVRVSGKCGDDSSFEGKEKLWHCKAGKLQLTIENPKLWWPANYGDANIYDTVCQLVKGDQVLAEVKLNVGLRTVVLDRSESLKDPDPRFQFIVNGVKIMCSGSNWVPLDAYHSRDIDRYEKVMPLFTDIGCNIIRVWGGGVYEQEPFYDYCDRHGIMVWQDFMMACHGCPMDDANMQRYEQEFSWVIRHLRHHPSIVLWAGDNEIDESYANNGVSPHLNRITRELLPKLVERLDAFRPYLPSSPYLPDHLFSAYEKKEDIFVERHLWGARDYFKADFYKTSKACFVSETGYHGCPNEESVRQIVDEDCVWPIYNEQWTLHSSDQKNSNHRVRLMDDQIVQLFGEKMTNLQDFIAASQISQAEAKKFFIEKNRQGRPVQTGIIWWNLVDGWPQMSDAVVDYYLRKKLAYDYIRQSQQPVCLSIAELQNWNYTLVASNDTRQDTQGSYRVIDLTNDTVICEGDFMAAAGVSTSVASIRMMYSEKKMLLIEWTVNGRKCYNHYLCGFPPFDFSEYKGWLAKLMPYYRKND